MNNSTTPTIPNAITMSSNEIADLCEKRHDHVMADCRKLAAFYSKTYSPEKSGELIRSDLYKDSIGRNLPCFKLNKQASLDLVTGYSLPHRHAVNKRWMELEETIRQPAAPALPNFLDPAEAAMAWAEQYRAKSAALAQIEQQQRVIEVIQPKAEALDRLAAADGSMCPTDAAKELKYPPRKLFDFLKQNGWIYRRGNGKNWLGYQDKIQAGLLEHEPFVYKKRDGSEGVRDSVKVTAKGLAKLASLLGKAAV